jgi:hypothetical protein
MNWIHNIVSVCGWISIGVGAGVSYFFYQRPMLRRLLWKTAKSIYTNPPEQKRWFSAVTTAPPTPLTQRVPAGSDNYNVEAPPPSPLPERIVCQPPPGLLPSLRERWNVDEIHPSFVTFKKDQ